MSLKFQTRANEYFEIMMILKNTRTVKSYQSHILESFQMTNNLACHEEETNSDGKLWFESCSLGTSLVSDFVAKCEKNIINFITITGWLVKFFLLKLKGGALLTGKVIITFQLVSLLIDQGNHYLSSGISSYWQRLLLPFTLYPLIVKGNFYLSSHISSYWQR